MEKIHTVIGGPLSVSQTGVNGTLRHLKGERSFAACQIGSVPSEVSGLPHSLGGVGRHKSRNQTISLSTTAVTHPPAAPVPCGGSSDRGQPPSSREAPSENILPHINRDLFRGQPKPHPLAFSLHVQAGSFKPWASGLHLLSADRGQCRGWGVAGAGLQSPLWGRKGAMEDLHGGGGEGAADMTTAPAAVRGRVTASKPMTGRDPQGPVVTRKDPAGPHSPRTRVPWPQPWVSDTLPPAPAPSRFCGSHSE